MVDQSVMVSSVDGPSFSALGRRDRLREEKAGENEKAEEGGEEGGMYPSLDLASEEYRKEDNLWKYDQVWVRERRT